MSRPLRTHAWWLFYAVCRYISMSAVTGLTAVRHFDVPDLRHTDGVLLASNHQSFLDPVLVGVALDRPVHYLARSSLFRPPGFGQLIRALGAHPLRRGKIDGSALRTCMQILRGGEPLLLFPEGTRSRDGSLGRMRPGAASLAARCEVPIIPVCIEGAFQAWPRTRALPRPAPVAVAYGRPLLACGRDGRELTEEIARRITQMQSRLRRFLGRTDPSGASRS